MFKVGDRVRCKDPGNNIGLDYGSVHKVLALPYKDMVTVSIVRNGADSCIRVYAFRFELIKKFRNGHLFVEARPRG